MKRYLITSLVLVGCSDASSKRETDRFVIEANALSLKAITGASYAVTVKNAADAVVWTRAGITSGQYGDGRGAISYIGTCDANSNPHTVELVLESLSDGPLPIPVTEFVNPAPAGRPIIVEAECEENADTSVVINLTVMRDAEQGFFDIAVNFEDIFCSAKVDCTDELLHDGADRGPTAVFGFVCTAGTTADGVQPTWLHMTDIELVCDGQAPLQFDPSGQPGNNGALGAAPTFFDTGIYRGQNQLPGLDMCYWNAAFGVTPNAANCRLRARATASHASFVDGLTPPNTIYPYVDFDVVLTDGEGDLICVNNGLDSPTSGVTTAYTGPGGTGFSHEWECSPGEEPEDRRVLCEGEFGNGNNVAVTPSAAGFSVSIGGIGSPVYDLPDDTFFGNAAGCCVNPCCAE